MVGKIIEFTTVSEDDGSLTFFEQSREIPFIIKRCFYVYDVPAEKQRADHASTTTDFVLIAINGGVKVELDDGVKKVCYSLTNSCLLYTSRCV